MKLISVIIPTYNRPDCIKFFLENIIHEEFTSFQFEIYDSSTNDDTKDIFDRYSKALDCISYHRCPSDLSSDQKIELAFLNTETDFVYLTGDSHCQKFHELENIILKKNDLTSLDLLRLENIKYDYFSKDINSSLYDKFLFEDNQIMFAKHYFVNLTMWGCSIIRANVIKKTIQSGYFDKYRKLAKAPDWIYAFGVTDYLSSHSSANRMAIVYTDTWLNYPNQKASSWLRDERWFSIAFEQFNNSMDLLPAEFNPVKKAIVKDHHDAAIVSKKTLLRLRINNVLTFRNAKKYKSSITKYDNVYPRIIALCIIPKFVLKSMLKTHQFLKRNIRKEF